MARVLAHTPLHAWHTSHGGRMVDFAGWDMPVQYASIVAEHQTTRRHAALFDVSHMGRFFFTGSAAAALLDRIVTRRVTDLAPGQIRYGLITNDQGGILDDVLVYHLTDTSGAPFFWMVVNASNRGTVADWIGRHLSAGDDVTFADHTKQTAMIAVQGPRALETAQPLLSVGLSSLKYYTGVTTRVLDREAIVSRTGYTGEDGCEIVVPAEVAVDLWQSLLSAGGDGQVMAAGLGARDTLRLEAAMPLYGHELSAEIDPYQAGLGFAVNLKNRQFPGCEVLAQRRQEGPRLRRVGLEPAGRRAARQSCPILYQGQAVGEVTSGTFSPTLQRPIAMGYVPPEYAEPGTELTVDIRGQMTPARVVPLPFYRRSSSGKG